MKSICFNITSSLVPVLATAISHPLESSSEPLALSCQVSTSCATAACRLCVGVVCRARANHGHTGALHSPGHCCATHSYTCAHGCTHAPLLQTDPSTGRVNPCCQSKTSLPAHHTQCSPSCAVTGCGYELLTSCRSQQWWSWHARSSGAAGAEGTP